MAYIKHDTKDYILIHTYPVQMLRYMYQSSTLGGQHYTRQE